MKDYLNKRGINEKAISEFGFVENSDKSISFNIEDLEGNIIGKKVRANHEIEKPERKYKNPTGVGNQLFNWHRVKNSTKIVIVEGEFDAILLWSLGINAISTTVGASGTKYSEEWISLLKDKVIYIWFDNDKAGHDGMSSMYKQFPNAKFIFNVEGDKADATDVWINLGEDGIKEALNSAEKITEPYISKFGIKFSLEVKKQIERLNSDSNSEFYKRLEEAKRIPMGNLLDLDQQGKVICPFHKEKTKSFSWDKTNNTFKCFGCGVQGDTVNFVQDKYNFSSKVEAINFLIGQPVKERPEEIIKAIEEVGDTISAEEAVLSTILKNNDAYFLIEGELQSRHFDGDKNRFVFKAMENLFGNNDVVDMTTLTAELEKNDTISNVGGSDGLKKLLNSTSSYKGITSYSKLIIEKSTKRELIELSGDIMDRASGNDESIDVIEFAEKQIGDISSKGVKDDSTVVISDSNKTTLKRIRDFMDSGKEIKGFSTGFETLDKTISGLNKGNLIVLGARPSVGKSTLALNIALNTAMNENKRTIFFSLEMSTDELTEKLLSSIAEVSVEGIDKSEDGERKYSELLKAEEKLKKTKLMLNDTAGLSIANIKAISRKIKRKGGLDFIVIDYLQLMSHSKEYNKSTTNDKVASISKGLKQLAKDLDVPVLVLSQLNREGGKRDVRPNLTNLRDSGAIEQDADVVMLLHRDLKEENGIILIEKNRHGKLGEVFISLKGEVSTFKEIEEYEFNSETNGVNLKSKSEDDFEF